MTKVTAVLISIDPGLSTGVAVFRDGEFVRSYTSEAPHTTLRMEVGSLVWPDEVVCEKGPTNHRRQAAACEPVEAIVDRSPVHVSWIRPSSWKRTPDAVLLDTDTPRNIHERDAIRMGRWRLARGWIGAAS